MAFHHLPEELQLYIFTYLDTKPPSELKNRHEPSLDLTISDASRQDIKHVSMVSRCWRRITLQLLFQHSRLQLDRLPRPKWENCRGCLSYASEHWASSHNSTSSLSDIASYHASEHAVGVVSEERMNANASLGTFSNLTWESRLYHCSKEFIHFMQTNRLDVKSFVLYTGNLLHRPTSERFSHRKPAAADRFKASAILWQRLLSVINPRRIVILAPPKELAFLANAAVDLGGEWAFTDMGLQILELEMDSDFADICVEGSGFMLATLCYTPDRDGGIADASIMKLRPWTHLSLNEGSFLKAYAAYEYFERGPPTIIHSIKNCIATSGRLQSAQTGLGSLRVFTYTAILPFATHIDFSGLLSQIEELDVRLAPHPDSNILNDKARVGKAELGDCWQEFFTSYRMITRLFATSTIAAQDGVPALKRFVCRDKSDTWSQQLREELDEEFIGLCLPIWGELEEGVYVRLADKAPYLSDLM